MQAATGKVRHLALTVSAPTIPAAELAEEICRWAISDRLAHEPGTGERGWDRLLTAPERRSAAKSDFNVVSEFHYVREELPTACPWARVGRSMPSRELTPTSFASWGCWRTTPERLTT